MKLFEITSLGDENAIGYLTSQARKNLNKIKNKSNKELKSLANDLLNLLDKFDENPNILQTDSYSLLNYLQLLGNEKVTVDTLSTVADALGSYTDESSD